EDIHQLAAHDIHQGVGDEERCLEQGEILVCDGDVLFDGFDRHRQGLAVEITDGDGNADEESDTPPRFHKLTVTFSPRNSTCFGGELPPGTSTLKVRVPPGHFFMRESASMVKRRADWSHCKRIQTAFESEPSR